jgi:glutathione peroxidase
MFEKIDVNGDSAHPLYVYLKDKAPGVMGTTGIKWNFTKFVVSRDGQSITRLASADGAGKLEEVIQQLI